MFWENRGNDCYVPTTPQRTLLTGEEQGSKPAGINAWDETQWHWTGGDNEPEIKTVWSAVVLQEPRRLVACFPFS